MSRNGADSGTVSLNHPIYLPNLTKIAIEGNFIFGSTVSTNFFIDIESDRVERISNEDDFEAVLKNRGASRDLLVKPDQMASRFAPQLLRPWEYQHMKNMLQHSDRWWSQLVVSVGTCFCFAIGLAISSEAARNTRLIASILLLLLVWAIASVVAYLSAFCVPGPERFAGNFVFPPLFIFVFFWGQFVRRLGRSRPHQG